MLRSSRFPARVGRPGLGTVAALGLTVALGFAATSTPAPPQTSTPQTQPVASEWAPPPAPYVILTFDDGPHPKYTAQILSILRSYGAKATFFQIGQNVARYPYLTRRAHLYGNSVQNHTWSHPNLRNVSWSTFRSQVLNTDSRIRAQAGYTPRCLRPPYGAVNSTVYRRAASLGKTVRLWTIDTGDWSRPGTSVIVRRVLNAARNGSVILMHDGGGDRSQTVAALPTILKSLTARGYLFYPTWCR